MHKIAQPNSPELNPIHYHSSHQSPQRTFGWRV